MLLEIKKHNGELAVHIGMKPEELALAMAANDRLQVLIAKAYMMSITNPVKVTKG